MVRIKKQNAVFGRYPCCDLLNRALQYILDNDQVKAAESIVLAIEKAGGYFYDDVAERLKIKPKE